MGVNHLQQDSNDVAMIKLDGYIKRMAACRRPEVRVGTPLQ